jgi:anaerobic selenocysteine-containing dehydrogenase
MTSVSHGYCTLCRSRCGTLNTVDSDRLLAVEPDHSHPTGNAMCMKGRAAPELVHSPHRVFYPMRRTSPKTEKSPGWKRISWEDALSSWSMSNVLRSAAPEVERRVRRMR